jgi:predicted aldo/keto reductase-like oxidoreductase
VERGQTDVFLTAYNFTMEPALSAAIQAGRAKGMGIVAMKVLAGGFSRIQRGDRLYGVNPQSLTGTLKREGAMQAAIRWALHNSSVDTAIVCMTDHDELDEDLRALAAQFSPKDREILAAQLAAIAPMYCRMCGTCSGTCPQGVPVADSLRILAYADGYRDFPLARQRFQELPQHASCADCASCAVKCPNGVQVRERLLRAQALFA